MLDLNTAKIIMDVINNDGRQIVTLSNVLDMEHVPIPECGYNVYSLQKEDVTILVWLSSNEINERTVQVKFICW